MSEYELPAIITNTLDRHGYVAITKEEHARLLRGPDLGCPYPLFSNGWGRPTHQEYIATIEHQGGEKTIYDAVVVVRCSACGHVTYESPVAIA